MKPTVEVEKLSKLYRLGGIGVTSIRESLEGLFRRKHGVLPKSQSARKALPAHRQGPEPDSFWALREVSFSVHAAEVVGILGRNGAGKSTLLKILSRITEPTSGRAVLRGRIASLLEVGTGFHPELTGRENIFLNGAILGLRRVEIAAKFDEIVEFAEVGAFLDTPVKRYSSGMFVRLAFAVAAHLEPEILLVDEVLAVGDAAFQKKCLGKMGEVAARHGRTVFFVSHNMGAIRSLCERALLIDDGRLTLDGKPGDVISHYLSSGLAGAGESEGEIHWGDGPDTPATDEVALRSLRLLNERSRPQASFEAGRPFTIEIAYRIFQRLRGVRFTVTLLTQEGEIAFCATDHLFQRETLLPGDYRSVLHLPGGLLNRRNYLVAVQCDVPGERCLIPSAEHLTFTIAGAGNQSSNFPEAWPGVVCPRLEWTVEEMEADPTPSSQNALDPRALAPAVK